MRDHREGDATNQQPNRAPRADLLQAALAERARFLEERPHLQAYQKEIDNLLAKSGTHQGRLAVLATLMQGKLLEIQKELFHLSQLIQTDIS